MKIVTFDGGFFFDDPNIRWGTPSYLLEPGDVGYVLWPKPDPKKKKRMKRNAYYPIRTAEQVIWLINFANKLPIHAAALGLAPAAVTDAVKDCRWLVYVAQTWLPAVRAWSLACTNAWEQAQDGSEPGAMVLPTFTPPELPEGVEAVAAGALKRVFTLIQQIKTSRKSNEIIDADLDIIGSEMNKPNLSQVQPVISAAVSGGAVEVKWNWGGKRAWLHSCEIQVDRADMKGFVLLTMDTTPNYTDTQPWPAAKTAWTYKAIYRAGDAQVGLWSQSVSVLVGG